CSPSAQCLPEGDHVSVSQQLEGTMMPQPANERQQSNEPAGKEEMLIPDTRARLTPAQMVERKLLSLLNSTPLLVSRLQTVRGPRWTARPSPPPGARPLPGPGRIMPVGPRPAVAGFPSSVPRDGS